ncbi:sodium-dependent lysophosphatidylcholine symporter 1 isoform X2 [Rhea pennata]|uniref:sodium-dependent lysophosphatidylcholine symporter 1 isoform X2 n=1 Tax=Rhea pennata TaxID=8795 RepID=UPI002E261951
MVGFFISKTSWTRFGRLMPWIIFSTPFAVISYFLIWFVPDISRGQVLWYLIFYCVFQTLVTCFHVPYSALTMFISREQSERDSATAYRMTVEVLGTVLGTAIQGQIVGKVDTPCIQSPVFLGETNSSVAMEEVNMTHDTGSLTDTRNAYMIAAGVIGGLYILCAVILSVGVREEREASELQTDEPVSFFQGLKLVMNHGAYIKLIAGFLFTSLAFMLLEGNFALFCTYTLGFRNEFQNILLAIMLSATLTIPLWQWFLTRFGKKTAVYVGISVSGSPWVQRCTTGWFLTQGKQNYIPRSGTRAGQGLIWHLSFFLSFVLLQTSLQRKRCPLVLEMAAGGLWEEACTTASPAVPVAGKQPFLRAGKCGTEVGKGQGCLHQALLRPTLVFVPSSLPSPSSSWWLSWTVTSSLRTLWLLQLGSALQLPSSCPGPCSQMS